ncbi:MAG: zinc-binding alcohol dehydrogenase family protein [Acidimicrobiia bacterium]|nr:zinc-binding alcohol dehydrogenase family protein [Acidimicrobiia bacterium]
MRAQQLQRPGPIGDGPLIDGDLEDPIAGPGDLVVEVTVCAVCRTDLQLVEGDLPARSLPITPGHQAVGHVVAVGERVTDWTVGDRAGIGWLAGTCGTCRFCTSGRENLCETAVFTGWDRDGGYASRAIVRADFALRMPTGRPDVELAPLLCGGVIGYRSLRASGIRPGGRLGLFGFGASASLAIQIATHWTCDVFVATRSEPEQGRAREMGAVWAGGYDEAIPEPLDAAVTFAPAGDVVVAALAAVDRGGVVAVNAIHLDHVPQFDYDLLWWEREIRSVANYTRADARDFLSIAAEIPIGTAVEEYPLAQANAALQDLKRGAIRGTAVLVSSQ